MKLLNASPLTLKTNNPALTPAQAKATYTATGQFQNRKPVFQIPPGQPLKLDSAFAHKGLCDGPTFTLGLLCAFSCSFCYVESLLGRHAAIGRICAETGLLPGAIVVEKADALTVLRRQLVTPKGAARYANPKDQRVVFASPLVDVASSRATAQQTVAACRLILENTSWQIRLLSKSALLQRVAVDLAKFRDRMIYGLSTGTFDDRLALSFERHASSPTARVRALHWLQDHGFRTFAMICPSLPQTDYAAFARQAADTVRVDQCEHVWAEVLNVRGASLARTSQSLRAGGFSAPADQLERVSRDPGAWEEYARATFLAHAAIVPASKLRFLQYVQSGQTDWWQRQQAHGAVLLGKHQ